MFWDSLPWYYFAIAFCVNSKGRRNNNFPLNSDGPNTKEAVPIVHCSSFVVSGGVKSKWLTWYAAADGRAGGKSSHNRNSDKVWSLSESAGAALDTKHWQKTWSSEDTYVVWPLCGTWNESASLTCWRRWVDILYTCTEKDTDKRHRQKSSKCHIYRQMVIMVILCYWQQSENNPYIA